MSYEELRQFKLQQLRPTRTRNLALAGVIWTGIVAICKLTKVYFKDSFSMYKTKADDFTKLDKE
jgi:hypothetical protein